MRYFSASSAALEYFRSCSGAERAVVFDFGSIFYVDCLKQSIQKISIFCVDCLRRSAQKVKVHF
jgi:hypothetical protein